MQHIFQASPLGRHYPEPGQAKMGVQKDESLEMSLREHLLAAAQAENHQPHQRPPSPQQTILAPLPVNLHQSQPSPVGRPSPLASSPIVDQQLGLVNPLESPLTVGHYAIPSTGLPQLNSKKPARPLSTTKRAAQNRAAQRAFRQRKDEEMKQLKIKVENLENEAAAVARYRREISELKNYALLLQSKLLSLQGECPPPPPNLDLGHGSRTPPVRSTPAASAEDFGHLQAAAAEASRFGVISQKGGDEVLVGRELTGVPTEHDGHVRDDTERSAQGQAQSGGGDGPTDYQSLSLIAALSAGQSPRMAAVSGADV